MAGAATAGEDASDRLRFIESRLRSETTGARLWTFGWAGVHALGFGYGTYQAAGSTNGAELTDGIAGATKSVVGLLGAGLRPLDALEGTRRLDRLPETTPDERAAKL